MGYHEPLPTFARINVHWFPEPQEKLLPALRVADAVEQCHLPYEDYQHVQILLTLTQTSKISDETLAQKLSAPLAFNLSASVESTGRFDDTKVSTKSSLHALISRSADLDNPGRNLVASHPVRIIHERPLLRTIIGAFLFKHHLLAPVCSLLLATELILLMVGLEEQIEVKETPDSPLQVVGVRALPAQLLMSSLLFLMFFLILHCTSSGMLRLSLKSFDGWALLLNRVVSQSIKFYSKLKLLESASRADIGFIVGLFFMRVTTILVFLLLANIDAVIFSRAWKLAWFILFLCYTSYQYVKLRFLDPGAWTSTEICLYTHCVPPVNIVMFSHLAEVVYLAKAVFFFLAGQEFAFLVAPYQECRTSEQAYELVRMQVIAEEEKASKHSAHMRDTAVTNLSYDQWMQACARRNAASCMMKSGMAPESRPQAEAMLIGNSDLPSLSSNFKEIESNEVVNPVFTASKETVDEAHNGDGRRNSISL